MRFLPLVHGLFILNRSEVHAAFDIFLKVKLSSFKKLLVLTL